MRNVILLRGLSRDITEGRNGGDGKKKQTKTEDTSKSHRRPPPLTPMTLSGVGLTQKKKSVIQQWAVGDRLDSEDRLAAVQRAESRTETSESMKVACPLLSCVSRPGVWQPAAAHCA